MENGIMIAKSLLRHIWEETKLRDEFSVYLKIPYVGHNEIKLLILS